MKNHQRDLAARKYVEDYLDAAERHMDTHASLQNVAGSLGVPIVKVSDHLGWRQEADRLMAAAETILADGETYGAHLDNMENGRARVERELSRLRHAVRDDGEYASQRQDTGTARRTCGYTGDSRTTRAREAGLDAGLRSTAPGLEQPHRRRPASRYPIILRQGLHRHHPAHPGIDGEPGYPCQVTSALDPGP